MTTPDQATTEFSPGDAPQEAAPLPAEAPTAAPPSAAAPSADPVVRTRTGRAWFALAPFAIVLALVLVFILQNPHRDRVRFLAWSTDLPLGVALLGAAVLGGLAVFCLGSIHIIQLRTAVRRTPRQR